jgi:hypothetical protein
MKNPIGNVANTKSHGTNTNYKKSGTPGLLKTLMNPMGALAKKFAPKSKILNALADPIGSLRGKNPAFAKGGDPNAAAAGAAGATPGVQGPATPPDEQAGPVVDPNAGVSAQGVQPVV